MSTLRCNECSPKQLYEKICKNKSGYKYMNKTDFREYKKYGIEHSAMFFEGAVCQISKRNINDNSEKNNRILELYYSLKHQLEHIITESDRLVKCRKICVDDVKQLLEEHIRFSDGYWIFIRLQDS